MNIPYFQILSSMVLNFFLFFSIADHFNCVTLDLRGGGRNKLYPQRLSLLQGFICTLYPVPFITPSKHLKKITGYILTGDGSPVAMLTKTPVVKYR